MTAKPIWTGIVSQRNRIGRDRWLITAMLPPDYEPRAEDKRLIELGQCKRLPWPCDESGKPLKWENLEVDIDHRGVPVGIRRKPDVVDGAFPQEILG